VSTDFLALPLFCFNTRQHGRQFLYFKVHVDGRKFHYRRLHAAVRSQVVDRCAKSYRLHNWYNCPSKAFVTSHAHACFSLWKSRKSRTMLNALTFKARSASAAYCTSPTRDVEVHGLVVRPITATSRLCFQSWITRSLVREIRDTCVTRIWLVVSFLQLYHGFKQFLKRKSTVLHRGVKLAPHGPNAARHAPFCCPRHSSLSTCIMSDKLRSLFSLCHSKVTFFVYNHTATLRL